MRNRADWLARERDIRAHVANARADAPIRWRLREDDLATLHHYFFLRHAGRQWLGRKFVLETPDGPTLPSRIDAGCLLGEDIDMVFGDEEAVFDVTLYPIEHATRFLRAASADPMADIVFPFPANDARGREWICPPTFWADMASRPTHLANDEQPMQQACADALRRHLPHGAMVLDPACSTGDFVSTMANRCPALRFEGSDLSVAMIEAATRRHAGNRVAFRVADAHGIPPLSCDGLILRFLNAEVVTRRRAMAMFDALVHVVRPGGIIIVFGHTPVLVPVRGQALASGLHVFGCTAPTTDGQAMFQCYVLGVSA